MKKTIVSLLLVVVLLMATAGAALASSGDITVKKSLAFTDPYLKHYVGILPKLTCVKVVEVKNNIAKVVCNDVTLYINQDALTMGSRDADFKGFCALNAGSIVYERPTTKYAGVVNEKAAPVMLYGVKKGVALIRNSDGMFGFTAASNLSKIEK